MVFDGNSKRKINLLIRNCEICKKEIPRITRANAGNRIRPTQYIKSRFCSNICRGISQKKEKIGKNNPNYRGGKSNCKDCGKELAQRYSWRHNSRCRDCYKKNNMGYNSPNWRGGKSSESVLLRSSIKNKQWRNSVFERDDFTCQICGDSGGGNLNAHHVKEWAKYPELRFNLDNGITLCKDCHVNIHKK